MLMWRIITILFVALAADVAYSKEQPQVQTTETKETTETGQRGSDKNPITIKIIPSPDAEAKAAQEQQYRNEKATEDKWLANATIWLAAITTLLAIFTGLLWWATYKLVREAKVTAIRQAEEMKDSLRIAGIASDAAKKSADASLVALRPWISCEAQIADSLTYTTEGDALFAFRFIVKNVGHSPAMNISFLPHLTLLSPKHELSLIHLQRMAEIYRSMPPKMTTMMNPGGTTGISEPGLLLFPGEHFTFNYRIPLKRSEIEKACEDIKPEMHFFPELCGFITYTYPLATVRADTGFVLRIEKALADGRRGDVLKLDEPVLLENMRLSDHGLWGGFAT